QVIGVLSVCLRPCLQDLTRGRKGQLTKELPLRRLCVKIEPLAYRRTREESAWIGIDEIFNHCCSRFPFLIVKEFPSPPCFSQYSTLEHRLLLPGETHSLNQPIPISTGGCHLIEPHPEWREVPLF